MIAIVGKAISSQKKQGRKHQLDTPKRMIERREREGERERGERERHRDGINGG